MKCIWNIFADGTDKPVAWLDHKPNYRFAIYNSGTANNTSDDLVLDKETGLIWPRNAFLMPTPNPWLNTRTSAREFKFANRIGWRLPTVEELSSLVDTRNSRPALPSNHPFVNVQIGATALGYVDSIARGDLTVLLSSGFKNTSTERTRQPLDKPTVLNIDNFASTQLMLKLSPVRNARSYEVRVKLDTAVDWKQAGIFTKARGILVEALIPGQVYDIQARAVGGTTGYSDWSDPVSRMAT